MQAVNNRKWKNKLYLKPKVTSLFLLSPNVLQRTREGFDGISLDFCTSEVLN